MSEAVIQVRDASKTQGPLLERLMQLYLYDFSEIEGHDVGRDGLFGHDFSRLQSYWSEADRFPLLIYVDHKIAGFVLINAHTCLDGNDRSIAEFFILRKYRRQGIGKRVAFEVFDRFRGKWEIRQIDSNTAAQKFWKNVVREYTCDRFGETTLDNDSWRGPIQSFDNSTNKVP